MRMLIAATIFFFVAVFVLANAKAEIGRLVTIERVK
jgi:hypothetical protein